MFALTLFLLCTWRGRLVSSFVRQHYASFGPHALTATLGLHSFIIWQTIKVAIDVPFIVMSPLVLWRLPSLLSSLFPVRSLHPDSILDVVRIGTNGRTDERAKKTKTLSLFFLVKQRAKHIHTRSYTDDHSNLPPREDSHELGDP